MNEELEALERIIDTFYDKDTEDINTVRNALKRFEMEHELRIRLENIIYEQSEILEILKERVVDIGYVIDCENEPEYLNRMCHRVYAEQNVFRQPPAYKRMTQAEFDLLKEWLKDE